MGTGRRFSTPRLTLTMAKKDKNGIIRAVFDVDSGELAQFDKVDVKYMGEIIKLIYV